MSEGFVAFQVDELNRRFEKAGPREVLQWGLETFAEKIAICSAFGPEGMVLLHMLSSIGRPFKLFTLDTGRLHEETYELMQKCEERYSVKIHVYAPDPREISEIVHEHGVNLFYHSVEMRELCCEVRKVRPMLRALEDLSAWITGLRRIQTVTRRAIAKIEIDGAHNGILKLNPLAEWSEQEVWAYIGTHKLPYNTLHDRGYRSIGCAPCTRATNPGEDIRAGRWWWEQGDKKECGIHVFSSGQSAKNGSTAS
jgi:thioredoxin-dependent adenylylsulfate APS reductase